MPFADYSDMGDCKRAHSDKDDPGAYCAQIHKNAKGYYPGQNPGDGKSLAGRAVDLIEQFLPGDRTPPEDGSEVKVYVPRPSCVPPGPLTRRDGGGWFYTVSPSEMADLNPPSDYVEIVPADEVLYPEHKSETMYPEAAPESAPPEVQEAVERWKREVPDGLKEDEPLLYWLLGTGTPAYKMPKDAVDYQHEPNGGEACAGCEFYYESADGKGICSQVRGEVEPDHWCRLWVGVGGGGGATGKGPWVPYAGPDGGRGWQDANNPDDVRYTDDPPGEPVNPDDISMVEYERVAEGLDGDVDGEDIKDMLREEFLGHTPEFSEGDTVAVDTDRMGRVEGEVIFYDGDFVDIETDDRGTVEVMADDVVGLVDEGEPDKPWGGPKNRTSVESEVTADDIRDGIQSSDVLTAVEKEQAIDAFNTTMGPDGDWREANDGVRDALDYALSKRKRIVDIVAKEVTRDAAYSNNSAPDHLDPTRAEEVETLSQTAGVDSGITAEAMEVCDMPDGGRLFVTHTDSTLPRQTSGAPQASGEDAVAAVDAANALEAMGFPAPDHHYEHNRFLAVEEVDGEPITDRITDGFDAPPDERQVERCMAAQILVGNRDPHSGNVMMVTEGGQSKAVCFDLDLSGLDLTPEFNQTTRFAIQKAAKTVSKATGSGLMSTMDDEEMAERVRDLASEVSIDDIRSAVKDEDMEETMVANIEAWRDYEEGDLY